VKQFYATRVSLLFKIVNGEGLSSIREGFSGSGEGIWGRTLSITASTFVFTVPNSCLLVMVNPNFLFNICNCHLLSFY
jgi:hypothetical protein